MEKAYLIDEELYVSIDLLEELGIPRGSILNGVSRYNTRRNRREWINVKHPKNAKKIYITYNSLPSKTKMKYRMPSKESLMEKFLGISKPQKTADEIKFTTIIISLKVAYDSRWRDYLYIYKNEWGDPEENRLLAKNHAVILDLINLKSDGYKIKTLHEALLRCEFDLKFKTDNLKWFYNKLKSFETVRDIKDSLIHGNKGKKGGRSTITEAHEKCIKQLYKNPKKYNYSEICKRTNEELIAKGFREVSLSSIKRFLAKKEIQNECKPFRNGGKWSDQNLLPHLVRRKPEHIGDQWQLDGTRLQFPYYNAENKKAGYLTIFVVLDIHSTKVVGYSLDKSENTKMVIQAISKAVENTGYIAGEIISDNGRSFKSDRFNELEELTTIMGVEWRRSKYSNPQDKGNVERFFNTFQTSVCKLYDGYVGEGIRSKREGETYSNEYRNEIINNKTLPTKEQLVKQTEIMIKDYNTRQISGQLSPNKKYNKSIPKHQVDIKPHVLAQLFWNKSTIKVRKSMINLTVEKVKYSYSIWAEKLIYELNNTYVDVHFQANNPDEIFIFHSKNKNYIISLKKDYKVQMALKGQSSIDKESILKYSSRKKSIKRKLAEKNAQEKKFLSDFYGVDLNDEKGGRVIHLKENNRSNSGSFYAKGSLEKIKG